MAAFTEGYSDTTGGDGHLGSMISKAIAARRFAEDERKLAEEKAKKAGYDSLEEIGVEKGYFFKAALKSKFGGSYLTGKRQDIKAAVDRVKLLKNPKAQFWNFVDNRDSEGKEIKKLNEVERFRKQFDNYNFQSAKRPPEKEVKAETEVVPKKISPFQLEQSRKAKTEEYMLAKTEAKTAKAASGGGGGRVSREDILTAVTAIASSLEKTAQSINNTIGETKVIADGVQVIKTDVVTQLSERTDSIENKLDAIVAAINAQTDLQKKMDDDAKNTKAIATQAGVDNTAAVETADDLTTDVDEGTDSGDELDDGMQPSPAATTAQDIEFQSQQMYQEREAGGIVSGPDEGYLAKLHGDEMVIPLDNNYTQGQPSAMDGKVRPKPESKPFSKRSYERGTPTQPAPTASKTGFTSLDLTGMGSKSDSAADRLTQPLMDAMSLPMMVAGGTILSSVSSMINQLGPENKDMAGEIQKIARPIADVFGLPNDIVNKTVGSGTETGESEKEGPRKEEGKKGMFGNMLDQLKNLFGGGGGGGGGSTTNGGGGGGGSASQKEVADVMGSEFQGQGLSEEGAKLALAEIGRENSLSRSLILGTHDDGGKTAYGAVSWQGGREKVLLDELKARGIDPTVAGLAGSGDEGLRANAAAMVKEIAARGHTELLDLLKKPNLTDAEKDKVRQLFKDQYFVYSKSVPLQRSRDWYETVSKMGQTPPSSTEDTSTYRAPESGQDIGQALGMKTHDKRRFMHDGVLYEAYKTTKGFEFFKLGGRLFGGAKIEQADPTLPAVTQSFLKSMYPGASQISLNPPAQSSPESIEQRQASLQPVRKERSGGAATTTIASLNTGGGKSTMTTPTPDSQAQVVAEGSDNSLTDMYNPTPVVNA